MAQIRLGLLKRTDCLLCEEMAAVVEDVVRGLGDVCVEAQDVDAEPALRARYGHEVPVLLVNGRKAFKYRVGPGQLRWRLWAERRRIALSELGRRLRR